MRANKLLRMNRISQRLPEELRDKLGCTNLSLIFGESLDRNTNKQGNQQYEATLNSNNNETLSNLRVIL